MIRHSLIVVAVAMCLAGCAAMEAPGGGAMPGSPPQAFAHRVATSELVLLWNCLAPGPGGLRVEGIGQNPWQAQPIQYLELELVGVDAQERTTAQTTGAVRNVQLMTNQSTPFQLELKTAGTEVRFDLYYHYRFEPEFDSAMLAGPPMTSPRLAAQTQTFLVRDACGANQHRAR
jgi:hypothetical protein